MDVLVKTDAIAEEDATYGKGLLHRIASMLTKMTQPNGLVREEPADFPDYEHEREPEREGVQTRVVTALSLALIALETGRTKDYLRIETLLESGAVSSGQISQMVSEFGLSEKWSAHQERFL